MNLKDDPQIQKWIAENPNIKNWIRWDDPKWCGWLEERLKDTEWLKFFETKRREPEYSQWQKDAAKAWELLAPLAREAQWWLDHPAEMEAVQKEIDKGAALQARADRRKRLTRKHQGRRP